MKCRFAAVRVDDHGVGLRVRDGPAKVVDFVNRPGGEAPLPAGGHAGLESAQFDVMTTLA